MRNMVSWTESEIQILKNHYFDASKRALCKILTRRTWEGIREKAVSLGLKRKRVSIAYRDAPQGCKRCSACKQFKPLTDFGRNRSAEDGYSCYCKSCTAKKRSTPQYMVKAKDTARKYRQRTRLNALQIIANSKIPKCVNCGCDFLPILEVNHKNGEGSKEYKKVGSAIGLFRNIVKGVRPTDDLEVLCEVCNRLHYVKLRYGKDLPFEIQWGSLK